MRLFSVRLSASPTPPTRISSMTRDACTPMLVHRLEGHEPFLQKVLFWALQPSLLVVVLVVWASHPGNALLYPLTLLGSHLLLGVIEYRFPARPTWRQSAREKLGVLAFAGMTMWAGGTAAELYTSLLSQPLSEWRTAAGIDVWPHGWPLVLQVFLAFSLSELLWYWMHRAEHRWLALWRLSGHGAHHAFKKLNAVHFAANHPVEMFWITLPSIVLDLVFGIGEPMLGALLLVTTQSAIAHSNLKLNARGIGLFFTTNAWHIRHHSVIFAESNSNYGCAAIMWDRIFGTFADSGVVEVGLGSTEPTLLEKMLIPIREPRGSVVAPSRPTP